MQWRDEGILLWVRRHGEAGAIVEALTAEHGRHSGLVRGGARDKVMTALQPGAQLSLEWSARLSDHLGTYKPDLIKSRAAATLAEATALGALNAISALIVKFLAEREAQPDLFAETTALLDAMAGGDPRWPLRYARWELALLAAAGFGVDLSRCAATGRRDDLVYVSPRSGRAVCRSSGAPFADRMLPLPSFLRGRGGANMGDVREALRMTGFFLENRACPALEIERLPDARRRLLGLLDKLEFPREVETETYVDDEAEWLEMLGAKDSLKVPTP